MNRENGNKKRQAIMTNQDNYIENFRKNVDVFMKEQNFTIRELSEKADIPFSTLNSFLYGNQKNCNLSTAIKLAKGFGVSVDELVGCDTISSEEREAIRSVRYFSKRTRYMLKWFIEFNNNIDDDKKSTVLNVMIPEFKSCMGIFPSSNFEQINIYSFPIEVKSKVFLGIKIIADYYMPMYAPDDILLIANDRPAYGMEHAIVTYYGKIHIVRRVIESGVAKYYSIRDGRFRMLESDVDSVIGYVADVYYEGKL